ncbi:MAG TPA: ankyrin repeat domain-containing protein, partial [Candidatus Wallbacteria bacterium]|nr:ankyrin repeat domain-containing protein [Candidatus Wallbacteria bacterium]
EELEKNIAAADSSKINQFVKDNYMLPAKRLLVEYAIENAVKKDIAASIEYIEYMFFTKKQFSENYSLVVIDSLNGKKMAFKKFEGSYERFFDEYVENIFSEKLSAAMKIMMQKIIDGGAGFEDYFYRKLCAALKNEDVIAASKLIQAFLNIGKSDAGFENILNMCDDLLSDEHMLDDAREKIKAAEENIVNAKTFIDSLKHGRRIEISGYFVGERDADEYEFEFVRDDNPGKHAVLLTAKTGLKAGEHFEVKAVAFDKKTLVSRRPLIESEWQYYIECPDSGTDKLISGAEEKMRAYYAAAASSREELAAFQKQRSGNDAEKEKVLGLIREYVVAYNNKAFKKLINAINSEDTEEVKAALSEIKTDSDVLNMKDETGWTALMYAVESGRKESVKLMLDHPLDINADSAGQTALMIAVKKGYVEIGEMLRNRGAVEIKEAEVKPLPVAAVTLDTNETESAEKLKSQLIEAVADNKPDRVKSLLNSGARADSRLGNGDTVLMVAVKAGFHEIIKALLEKGADANFKNDKNQTPLTYAISSGDEKSADILRGAGARLDEKTLNADLLESVKNNNIENIKALLSNGANVNACDPLDNSTPLIYAAGSGDMRILKLIAENGGGLEMKTAEGWTALMKAIIKNRPEAAGYLLEQKMDIEITDNDGNTALLLACQLGRLDIADMLVKKGADIGKANKQGLGVKAYVKRFPGLAEIVNPPGVKPSGGSQNVSQPSPRNDAPKKRPSFESNASKSGAASPATVSDEERRALEKINRSLKK